MAYDIALLENGKLSFGSYTETLDGSTAAKRPTAFDTTASESFTKK